MRVKEYNHMKKNIVDFLNGTMVRYCPFLMAMLMLFFCPPAEAQIHDAGLPLSFSKSVHHSPDIPIHRAVLPDWVSFLDEHSKKQIENSLLPFPVGLFADVQLKYPESGSFLFLDDGHIIWRASLRISGAPALGLYYSDFRLPEGVRLFVYNKNRRHILGAYTSSNNSEDGKFAQEAVQGDLVHIELNIASGAKADSIKLHIDRALVVFRGMDYLKRYKLEKDELVAINGDPDPYGFEGNSSYCMINAACPEGQGYEIPRNATVQMLLVQGSYAYYCSAVLVNNTGNTAAHNCKPYLLTASHCADGTQDASFSQWLFRFNFEKEHCDGGPPAIVNTMTGAQFRARSSNAITQCGSADFLLLELKDKIPESWNAYLSGWDRSTPKEVDGKHVSFHHPDGDVKKMSFTQLATVQNDAWVQVFRNDAVEGGISSGSSGSGLFNPEKKLIGIASLAGNLLSSCVGNNNPENPQAGFYLNACYYSLSAAWAHHSDTNRSLKYWLDPIGSGVISLEGVSASCENNTGTISVPSYLDDAITVYPNPSRDGLVNIQFNLDKTKSVQIDIQNINGRKCGSYALNSVLQDVYKLDMSRNPPGVYMITISDGIASSSRKIVLTD